jgi:ferredoxin
VIVSISIACLEFTQETDKKTVKSTRFLTWVKGGIVKKRHIEDSTGTRRSEQNMESVKRKVIDIDEEKCDGCGLCIPNCPEGALQILDGKARLVSDLFCDGLGACLGHCPRGAIRVGEREAEPYDERRVMANIAGQGEAVIRAHLEHLREHGEESLYAQALSCLDELGIALPGAVPAAGSEAAGCGGGCPGARPLSFAEPGGPAQGGAPARASRLGQWPVQLHLLPASAPWLRAADLLLSADCVAYALGGFHDEYLAGKKLAIACPKLDGGQEVYIDKLTAMIDQAGIRSITVMTMEVPCCRGLLSLVERALAQAHGGPEVTWVQVSIRGEILNCSVPFSRNPAG